MTDRSAERRTNIVWLLLMAVTITTTWVLSKDAVPRQFGTVAILALAAWKVRWVLLDFMELRHAPLAGRIVFEVWAFGVAGMIAGFYLAV